MGWRRKQESRYFEMLIEVFGGCDDLANIVVCDGFIHLAVHYPSKHTQTATISIFKVLVRE